MPLSLDCLDPALQAVVATYRQHLVFGRHKGRLGILQPSQLQQQLDIIEARIVVGRIGHHRMAHALKQGVVILDLRIRLLGMRVVLRRKHRAQVLVEKGA